MGPVNKILEIILSHKQDSSSKNLRTVKLDECTPNRCGKLKFAAFASYLKGLVLGIIQIIIPVYTFYMYICKLTFTRSLTWQCDQAGLSVLFIASESYHITSWAECFYAELSLIDPDFVLKPIKSMSLLSILVMRSFSSSLL